MQALLMSQQDQEQDMIDAQHYLSCTSWSVDRCRHENCVTTSLWIFNKEEKQVGVIARQDTTSKYKWYAQKMLNSQPVTNMPFETLSAACAYALNCFDK